MVDGSHLTSIPNAISTNSDHSQSRTLTFRLPFHKRVMKDSMQWLDIYKERGSQKGGAARVHLMDAVCLINASCPLF